MSQMVPNHSGGMNPTMLIAKEEMDGLQAELMEYMKLMSLEDEALSLALRRNATILNRTLRTFIASTTSTSMKHTSAKPTSPKLPF